LPTAVRVKLLVRLLYGVGGGQKPRALGQVERLDGRIAADDGVAVTLLGVGVRCRGDTLWFIREAGRQPEMPVTLAPRTDLVWDKRFAITNRSTVPLSIRMARELSRASAEVLLAKRLLAPSAAIRSAPLVTAEDGMPLALGCHVLADGVSVDLLGSNFGRVGL
jgi:tRNA(Ile)-lysidine synthase